MPDLPVDIIRHVLDFVPEVVATEDIKEELSNFALISTSWSDYARRKLFNNFLYSFRCPPIRRPPGWVDLQGWGEWDGTEHYNRWGRFYGEPQSMPYKTLAMLVDFLEAHEHCANAVHSLTLHAYRVQSKASDIEYGLAVGDYYGPENEIDPFLLAKLLDLLPELEELKLIDVVLSGPLPSDYQINHPRLHTLTANYNSMRHGFWQGGGPFLLLQSFQKLPKLVVDGTGRESYCWPPRLEDLENSMGPAVEFLTVVGAYCPPQGVFELLMRSPTSQTLRTLELTGIGPEIIPPLQQLLNAAGPSLKTLRYEIAPRTQPRQITIVFVSLEPGEHSSPPILSVSLEGSLACATEPAMPVLDPSACTAPEVLELTFDVLASAPLRFPLTVDAVGRFLAAMARGTFPSLKTLAVEVRVEAPYPPYDDGHAALRPQLESALLAAAARGAAALRVSIAFVAQWRAPETSKKAICEPESASDEDDSDSNEDLEDASGDESSDASDEPEDHEVATGTGSGSEGEPVAEEERVLSQTKRLISSWFPLLTADSGLEISYSCRRLM